ncbi:hypothetical protein F511_34238 [Dorcoceras hygrometricum]|uniref:Uncharacterized protein n=1 Tax=Dorcoceras hygrometricum TaxID=472368 RepID=A0A2Z7CQ55_9LAMI|nr:hypothetical protein F511_34238 [Dorcoceras hygrometricum]
MSTINTSSLSDHLPPAPTADYLQSMKTSEPKAQQLTAESFSSVHSRITVLCSTADSADVKVADPPVVSTADPDFLLLHLLLVLSSTTDQTSHLRMRPFPPKRGFDLAGGAPVGG